MKRDLKFIKKIHNEYLNGSTQAELDNKYSIDSYYYFKKHKLKTRSTGQSRALIRKNCIKLNYNFKSISNEKEAYIIGLMFADGYQNGSQIGLKSKDKDLIEEVKNYFSKEIVLQKSKNGKYYSFVISSKEACFSAEKLGFEKSKTKKEISIPKMKDNLIIHFIRGYFDGDGTIFICNDKNNKSSFLKGNICSPTKRILEEIQCFLKKNNISTTINIEKRVGKKFILPQGKYCVADMDMYRLYFRKKEDIKKLFFLMYNNSTMYMKRKYNVFNNNKHLFIK